MAYGTVQADVIGTSVAGSNIGAGNASIMKNRLINGSMVINQRNTSITATGYSVDRWKYTGSQSSKGTVAQSTTAPSGFTNSLGFTSSSAYSITSTDFFFLAQCIEGYNIADLGWGTASAKTVTLSFQVYSSLTGTFGGVLTNGANNRTYPFSYTISAANTWTTISITVAGDTTGTWATDNTGGLFVLFSLGSGSTYSGTAGSWSANTYFGTTSTVSVVGTNGATWFATGVQLEVGSSATGYEYRQYGQELALCQRYCQTISGVGNYSAMTSTGSMAATTVARNGIPLLVTMRSSPSATFSAANTFLIQQNGSNNLTPSAVGATAGGSNQSYFFVDFTVSGGVAGTAANAFDNNSTSAKITLTSEL
jgi:hypothetical protein